MLYVVVKGSIKLRKKCEVILYDSSKLLLMAR